ncbi:hypothetical protein ACEN2J_20095 [Pseudorhodobacter sp. W20_MBD10_FR17]|uniref:hypothetical protein n=1 Tax=Pseudorhodobacter sp. W20_MBD10_FR17 TaxID=3240266 RepID=UPI003F9D069D
MKPAGLSDFDAFLLLIGKLNYAWTNTESLLIHVIAGLSGMNKETATIVFLTLNTTRARLNLVERLSKLDKAMPERAAILALTGRIQKLAGLRNRYNHCIYAFDAEGGPPRSILMRISDRGDKLKIGQTNLLDKATVGNVETAIQEMFAVNQDIWRLIAEYNYPN